MIVSSASCSLLAFVLPPLADPSRREVPVRGLSEPCAVLARAVALRVPPVPLAPFALVGRLLGSDGRAPERVTAASVCVCCTCGGLVVPAAAVVALRIESIESAVGIALFSNLDRRQLLGALLPDAPRAVALRVCAVVLRPEPGGRVVPARAFVLAPGGAVASTVALVWAA